MKFRVPQLKMQEAGDQSQGGGAAGASMGNSSTGEAGNAHQTTNQGQNNGQSGTGQAQASGTQGQSNNDGDSEFNFDTLPKSAQDYIKSLRQESADHRTKNNNLNTRLESIENGFKQMFGGEGGEQDLTPEQQIEQMQGSMESMSYENAIMGLAYENGIPMDNYEYFNFLMDKAVNSLEEGQELSEEQLMEVIQKSKSGMNQDPNNTNTSVDGDNGNNDPNQSGEMTLEAFSNLNVVEKSELYRKNPALYNQLFEQAKGKRLL